MLEWGRFGPWFGSMRFGVASIVHVWAYCEDCSYHRRYRTCVKCIIAHNALRMMPVLILSNAPYDFHSIAFDIPSVSVLLFGFALLMV